ncbi:hypothetical protein DFJ77DRAFT_276261 [Powellomyces hirtus]|nr:hypothetical protein DFJ77DRAFT_276261 [Powellomyces hirtus]
MLAWLYVDTTLSLSSHTLFFCCLSLVPLLFVWSAPRIDGDGFSWNISSSVCDDFDGYGLLFSVAWISERRVFRVSFKLLVAER